MRLTTCSLALLSAVVFASCARAGSDDRVLARVGTVPITTASLAHWMSVFAPARQVPDPPRFSACVARQKASVPAPEPELSTECSREYQRLKRQALGFLISADWMIGEAADKGVAVSAQEAKQRVEQKASTFPGGAAAFREALAATGRVAGDSELEAEAGLASGKLAQLLSNGVPSVTRAQAHHYYTQHLARFVAPERRYLSIAEFLSPRAAERLMSAVRPGKPLETAGIIHEVLSRSSFAQMPEPQRAVYEAIFAAKPGEVVRTVAVNQRYLVFEVTRRVPAVRRSFAQVRASIAATLAGERRRRALSSLVAAWTRTWTARTDCRAGYVVQKCRQYDGPRTPEDPFNLG